MDEIIRAEVVGLVRYVERLKLEIAKMAQGRDVEESNFQTMSAQLDAIVKSTEQSSNVIMEASEKILSAANQLDEELSKEERQKSHVEICARAIDIIEACSFQDLAGQRVTKILHSLHFVEERVDKMIKVCGSDAINELIGDIPEATVAEGDVEMEGPALEGEGISQEEIDALFD
ncbi:MAG: hypothetical protein JKX94_08290 [Sneathiella sp.]|nr:hypothetical protein [Sneathiella sp.]